MAFKFENLKVWQISLEVCDEIYMVTEKFPKQELYVLSTQMRRAANSISLNIVEGSTGLTDAELKRFLTIANRPALEVVGCLFLAKRRRYINNDKFAEIYGKIEKLVKMIQSLINSLNE
jgi:four helix bundle protein